MKFATPVDAFGRPYRHYRDEDGHHRVASQEAMCDFCSVAIPSWEYPCGIVELAGHPAIDVSDDEWGACQACHELIEAGAVDELVERCLKVQRRQVYEMRLAGHDMLLPADLPESLRANIDGFMAARQGPPRPWTDPTAGGRR